MKRRDAAIVLLAVAAALVSLQNEPEVQYSKAWWVFARACAGVRRAQACMRTQAAHVRNLASAGSTRGGGLRRRAACTWAVPPRSQQW